MISVSLGDALTKKRSASPPTCDRVVTTRDARRRLFQDLWDGRAGCPGKRVGKAEAPRLGAINDPLAFSKVNCKV